MEMQEFVRRPFVVEAVEVTRENIAELAPLIGTLRQKDDGTPFIKVNPRFVPNVFFVYPGFWMTKLGDNIRCYSKKIFNQQFIENDENINTWIDYINKPMLVPSDEDIPLDADGNIDGNRVDVTVAGNG